jgi:hypothetical protein
VSYHRSDLRLGRQYLAELWLRTARTKTLKAELSDCRRSPTLQGEGAAILIAAELERREREKGR